MKRMTIFVAIMAVLLLAGNVQASIFATELVAKSASLDGSTWYNDPNDLLGKPTLTIPGGFGNPAGGPVSIIEPAFGDNRITTFNKGQWAVVGFDH